MLAISDSIDWIPPQSSLSALTSHILYPAVFFPPQPGGICYVLGSKDVERWRMVMPEELREASHLVRKRVRIRKASLPGQALLLSRDSHQSFLFH